MQHWSSVTGIPVFNVKNSPRYCKKFPLLKQHQTACMFEHIGLALELYTCILIIPIACLL